MTRFLALRLSLDHTSKACRCFMLFGLLVLLSSTAVAEKAHENSSSEKHVTTPSARVMQLWAGSCALCHVNGNAGAPVIGDRQAWQPRQRKGLETLLKHTLEGFNDMPPLGYCMACERDDFLTLIQFMTGADMQTEVTP